MLTYPKTITHHADEPKEGNTAKGTKFNFRTIPTNFQLLASRSPESWGVAGIEILISTKLITSNTEMTMSAHAAVNGVFICVLLVTLALLIISS